MLARLAVRKMFRNLDTFRTMRVKKIRVTLSLKGWPKANSPIPKNRKTKVSQL